MEHFVSMSCSGELCGICQRIGICRAACHKIGEEIPTDAPAELQRVHNLTQYVCCQHFSEIFRPESAQRFRGCEAPTVAS